MCYQKKILVRYWIKVLIGSVPSQAEHLKRCKVKTRSEYVQATKIIKLKFRNTNWTRCCSKEKNVLNRRNLICTKNQPANTIDVKVSIITIGIALIRILFFCFFKKEKTKKSTVVLFSFEIWFFEKNTKYINKVWLIDITKWPLRGVLEIFFMQQLNKNSAWFFITTQTQNKRLSAKTLLKFLKKYLGYRNNYAELRFSYLIFKTAFKLTTIPQYMKQKIGNGFLISVFQF